MSLDVNMSEPDEFNCIELHNCIKSVAEIYNIEIFTYHVDIVGGKGENYISNVFRVSINETDKDTTISVIVKTLINTTRQDLFRELHNREVNAYKLVIYKFVTLQNDIELDERTVLPKCIFTSTSKNNEVIILEDLVLDGFVIESKFDKYELNYPKVCFTLTELAKFHALSFVFRDKEENSFEGIRDDFKDIIFEENFLNKTKLWNYFQESFDMSLNLIADVDAKKKLETVKDKLIGILRTYTEPKTYNVFCHGDCWINNILFKEQDDKKQLCFLDFQAMRYASPVTDIMYFLYVSTDSAFRQTYFEDLKIAYYSAFKMFLKKFNIDANTVYPEEEFHKEIMEMLPYGLLIALIELRIVTTSLEDEIGENETTVVLDNDGDDVSKIVSASKKLYEIRVNDVINESVNNGVLDKLLNLVNY